MHILRSTPGLRPMIAALLLQTLVPTAVQAAEPTIEQIHALATTGHLDQALAQMASVLKSHPDSAKAHYVEAEILARADRATQGRSELARAEQIAPGLPFADVYSVAELNRQLSLGPATPVSEAIPVTDRRGGGSPWLLVAALAAAVFGLIMLFRRRTAVVPPPFGQSPFMQGPSAPAVSGIWNNPAGSGTGTGLLGNLASGAAMGAGFAVGEEAIEKIFGGDEYREIRTADDHRGLNQDMGGDDFGIADGGSWDDPASDAGGW